MHSWILLVFLFTSSLFASIEEYLLPRDHFLQKALNDLFQNREMFQSRETFSDEGFQLLDHHHRGLMVARHPKIAGFLFKKFTDETDQAEQLENYLRRIRGARSLAQYIDENRLQHIVTPKKWLYPCGPKSYLLIAEEIDICSSTLSKQKYAKIKPEVLRELCLVLSKFRGLDSVVKNMPFTHENQIAFIDTERWESRRSIFLKHVVRHLDEKRRQLALRAQHLLGPEHELYQIIPILFPTKDLFESPKSLQEAGFKVHERVHKGLMVFSHPAIKNYLFKKYHNGILPSYQLKKYLRRLEGAKKVKRAIESHELKQIIVPNKWLLQLGEDDFLVVAEKIEICPGDDKKGSENIQRYRTISFETLKELCTVLKALGGCDAWPRNQPFTPDGQIAFIDTEHVGEKESHFDRHIMPLLDEERQAYALEVLGDLERARAISRL